MSTDLGAQALREQALQQIAKSGADPATACEAQECTQTCAKCLSAAFDLWCVDCKTLLV